MSTALDSTRDEKKRESRRLLSNRLSDSEDGKGAPSRAGHVLSAAVARDGTGEREREGERERDESVRDLVR